jgi:NADH-quinone oxidoreductase subunit E
MAFSLNPERQKELEEILARYPNRMAACLPVMHLAQNQRGYIDDEVTQWVADTLKLSTAHVFGVATFYSLFNTAPVGRHQVWVCRTLSCALRGADQIVAHCERRLGIHCGDTTPDGSITLRTAECLASCGTAPMMQVDRDYHENLTLDQVDVLLDRLRSS